MAAVPADKSKYSLLKWNYQYKTIHVKRITADEIPSSTFKEWISLSTGVFSIFFLLVDRRQLAFSQSWQECIPTLVIQNLRRCWAPVGKGKGGKRWRKRMKWQCTALMLIRAGVADHQFILIHGIIARSDLLFLLFNYLFIFISNLPEQRFQCPQSIMFGAGTLSGLESFFPCFPVQCEVPECHQIKKWKH